MDKHEHIYATKEYGGGFNAIAATIIIILVAVGLLYFTSAVSRNSADQQSAQEPSQGVIKPPNTGDTGIHTTAPHPNADSNMEVIPPRTPEGEPR